MKPVFYLLIVFSVFITACNKADDPIVDQNPPVTIDTTHGNMTIEIAHYVDTAIMQLNTQLYINAHTDTFSLTRFRYYLSNIRLKKSDGTWWTQAESYFLIDEATKSSKSIYLENIPAGNYTEINFLIGIDSARNTAGAQTGVLDPINGMFWDWNSGYIFFKLEGNSNQAPFGDFLFHLGGYKDPTNVIKNVTLNFNGANLHITQNAFPSLFLKADAMQTLNHPNVIDFSVTHHVTGGPDLMLLTENYADMYSFDKIVD